MVKILAVLVGILVLLGIGLWLAVRRMARRCSILSTGSPGLERRAGRNRAMAIFPSRSCASIATKRRRSPYSSSITAAHGRWRPRRLRLHRAQYRAGRLCRGSRRLSHERSWPLSAMCGIPRPLSLGRVPISRNSMAIPTRSFCLAIPPAPTMRCRSRWISNGSTMPECRWTQFRAWSACRALRFLPVRYRSQQGRLRKRRCRTRKPTVNQPRRRAANAAGPWRSRHGRPNPQFAGMARGLNEAGSQVDTLYLPDARNAPACSHQSMASRPASLRPGDAIPAPEYRRFQFRFRPQSLSTA